MVYGGDEVDVNVTTTEIPIHYRKNVGTTEELLHILPLTTAAGALIQIKNLDATNFVSILQATAGDNLVKVKAGERQQFRFGSAVTAPYIIADTAACDVEITIYGV